MIRFFPGAQALRRSLSGAMLLAATLLGTGGVAHADSSATAPVLPGKVALEQKLNAQIPLDVMFRDENGQIVRLHQLLRGKPILLNFMYYRCPMLCSMVMEGLSNSLSEVKFDVGTDFDIITVSIDPRDRTEDALAKKDKYVKLYGRLGAANGWHFLTGHETGIKTLASAVGFQYAYDPETDQFAHAAALLVLTPDGRVSRYFSGFEYKPRDLRLALVEASSNKIATPSDLFLLLCYHYDPHTGKYSRSAMGVMRAGGVATVFSLGGFIFLMLRKEKKHPENNDDTTSS